MSAGGHSGGGGWGEGNRPRDPYTGRYLRPEHMAEEGRQGERGRRNIASQRLGPNREARMREELQDLRDRIQKDPRGIEGLDKRDRGRFKELKDFFEPEEDALKEAKDKISKQDINDITGKLDGIKSLLEDSLKIQ